MKIKSYLAFICLVFLFSCQRKITETRWVYVEGAYICDVLDFKGGFYAVRNEDEIWRVDKDVAIGTIISHKRMRLIVSSPSGEKGIYKYLH